MEKSPSIKSAILKHIKESEEHSVFFITDFAESDSPETIRKVLSEATEQNLVEHIAHGIYVKPKLSRFGAVPISLETIAQEIAKRDHAHIMPTGATASNILGMSTQIPMIVSYISTGSSRTIKIGKRAIRFKHAAPRNFSYKGTTIPLIVQAFKEYGEANIGDYELSAISTYLSKAKDRETFITDIRLAPQWIQSQIKPLIKQTL